MVDEGLLLDPGPIVVDVAFDLVPQSFNVTRLLVLGGQVLQPIG